MEKKKANLSNTAGAGKTATSFFHKAKDAVMNVADQDGDGKLGLSDVSAATNSVKAAVQDSSNRWTQKQEKRRRNKEFEMLHPLFESDLDKPDFSLPKLIRVAEMDEKHAQSEICKNSIGYVFSGKELDVITIYPEIIPDLGLRFHPDTDSEVYYVDPADRDFYIALDDYFNYLKIVRIGELQRIAQDLGAKHFRVTFKEHQKLFASNEIIGKTNLRGVGKLGSELKAEHLRNEKNYSKIEIAAEMTFIGHKPENPALRYFKKDPQIQNLIAMRMNDNSITHQVFTLNLGNSSGIKEKDAAKIDSALGAMKLNGKTTVASETQREMQRVFEYEIDF